MILHQRFIELGEGYGDIFELCELMRTNRDRLHRYIHPLLSHSHQAMHYRLLRPLNPQITATSCRFTSAEKELSSKET